MCIALQDVCPKKRSCGRSGRLGSTLVSDWLGTGALRWRAGYRGTEVEGWVQGTEVEGWVQGTEVEGWVQGTEVEGWVQGTEVEGWVEGTEVEFMIDTGCQLTILATSVFYIPNVCFRPPGPVPAASVWLILADSSLIVRGELEMAVGFPGLRCRMVLVVAGIGSEGLLGTEALPSCLPHQLDLRTGQLWADGQSTLQLHQQRQAAQASAHLMSSLVLPPDSEIVAGVSICSSSGVRPGRCSLIEPQLPMTEDYGVLVGRTLVDASEWSASVLLVNPGSDVVVLPSFSCVGDLVPASVVSVARSTVGSPGVGPSRSTWKILWRVLIFPWEWRGGQRSGISCISMLMCFMCFPPQGTGAGGVFLAAAIYLSVSGG